MAGRYNAIGSVRREAIPSYGGHVESNLTGGIDTSGVVTATAIPYEGYRFDHWAFEYDGTASLEYPEDLTDPSLTIDNPTGYSSSERGNLKLIAYFVSDGGDGPEPEPTTYTVSTSVTKGRGTTSGDGTYEKGKSCTISATPQSGWEFRKWTDKTTNATIKTNPYTFTVDRDYSFECEFRKKSTGEILYSPSNGGQIIHRGSPMFL